MCDVCERSGALSPSHPGDDGEVYEKPDAVTVAVLGVVILTLIFFISLSRTNKTFHEIESGGDCLPSSEAILNSC